MKIIIVMAACILSLSVTAQEKSSKHKDWEKMKQYMPVMTKSIGVSFQEFDGLNNRMAGFPQYKTLRGHTWTVGLGSMHNIKNFISQINVKAGSSLTGDPDERSSAVRTFGGSLDLGYDVIPSARIMLYPMAGIGTESFHAIFYKDVNAVDFDDVASSPSAQNSIRSVKFTNRFTTYRFGLGLGFKSPDGAHSIGLQGFYEGSFKDNKPWRSSENQSLSGAPVDDLERISVSLVITGNMMGMGKHK
jgi:opacity protein-like surface antigen